MPLEIGKSAQLTQSGADARNLQRDFPVLAQERLETSLIGPAMYFDSPLIHTMVRRPPEKITDHRCPRRFIAYNRGIQGVA
ncbi:MAG TPA: hypothetical protein VFW60_07070 [Rhodanobacteraceae bacterium]|nr:hypothetical protein [Rhodanobacteraceae bacterium]